MVDICLFEKVNFNSVHPYETVLTTTRSRTDSVYKTRQLIEGIQCKHIMCIWV